MTDSRTRAITEGRERNSERKTSERTGRKREVLYRRSYDRRENKQVGEPPYLDLLGNKV
jgi:hypothetical protein